MEMTGPSFVGVSTGRSGSVWAARVMNDCGLPCSHEEHFRADRYGPDGPEPWPDVGLLGEWSAQAVPYLRRYAETGTWIIHLVRHPLKVIGSYLDFGLFAESNLLGDQGEFMRRHANIVGADPLAEATRFWVDWNRRIELWSKVTDRYRRIQVEQAGPSVFIDIGGLLGRHVAWDTARAAVENHPTTTNSRHSAQPVEWSDLPRSRVGDDLRQMARRYGYPVR